MNSTNNLTSSFRSNMKKLLYITGILLISTIPVKGQDTSDIKLLNDFLFEVAHPHIRNSQFIQLAEFTYPCRLHWSFESYFEQLQNHIDSVTLSQIIRNSLTVILERRKWKDGDFDKVKLLTREQIDSLQENNRKGIKDLQTSVFYVLTPPIYDDSGSYAVVDFGGGTAVLQMIGSYYLLKKINGKWTILTAFSGWAS